MNTTKCFSFTSLQNWMENSLLLNLNDFPKISRGARICCKHVCRSCYKQDEVATYEFNVCPKLCACHMTSQAHLTTVKTNSLSLFTNTSKTKPFQSCIFRVSRSAELVASKQPASRLDYNRNGYWRTTLAGSVIMPKMKVMFSLFANLAPLSLSLTPPLFVTATIPWWLVNYS